MKIKSAYILAGGKSQRMGEDKLFMKVDGKYLLENTIEICKEIFENVILVAKESEKFNSLGCRVVLDSETAQGPMAGIISALKDCKEESCFVTAADFRDLNSIVIESLINAYRGEQYLGLSEKRNIQPLCGIYATSSLYNFAISAMTRNYSLKNTISHLKMRLININSINLRNINFPEDLRK